MQLPALTHWDETRSGLHHAAQVLSAFRKAYSEPQPNALHLALYVSRRGVTTGATSAGEFELDFRKGLVCHTPPDGTGNVLPVNGISQVQLAERLLKSVQATGTDFIQEFKPPQGETPIKIDVGIAAEYSRALYQVYSAMASFRARLFGTMSPMVVWGHGFDLSTLWFKGHNPDEHHEPHLNFGFSPGSAGIERPYLYAYAYPMPDGLVDEALPAPAKWHTEGWTGVRIDYDDLRGENDPEQVIEHLLRDVYTLLSSRL